MHETHDGVQDMACDTFIKIALKCRRHFVTTQIGESCPFIEDILASISTIICDLQQQQVHTFYEAVGYMISAQVDAASQEQLIEKYMLLPNQVRNFAFIAIIIIPVGNMYSESSHKQTLTVPLILSAYGMSQELSNCC